GVVGAAVVDHIDVVTPAGQRVQDSGQDVRTVVHAEEAENAHRPLHQTLAISTRTPSPISTPSIGSPNSKLVARISPAMRSRWVCAQSARSEGTDMTTRMRSETSSPVDLRSSCSSRMRSLAQPSASSSGVTVPSNTTRPAPSGSAAVNSGSAATSRELYSSGCSTAGPAVNVPSVLTTASPALTALIAACTSLPRRGPATLAFTVTWTGP